MSKLLFTSLNLISTSALPASVVINTNDSNKLFLENYNFANINKINRNNYDINDLSNLNSPVEVSIIVENAKFEKDISLYSFEEISQIYQIHHKQIFNLIFKNLEDLVDYSPSSFSPIMILKFSNHKNLKLNLLKLSEHNQVIRISSYEGKEIDFDKFDLKESFEDLGEVFPNEISNIEKQFITVNFDEQRKNETIAFKAQPDFFKNSVKRIKLGIMEPKRGVNSNLPAFKNRNIIYEKAVNEGKISKVFGSHANSVAAIAAGINGVDRFVSDIYSSWWTEKTDDILLEINNSFSSWMAKIEEMVGQGVHVINHSYNLGATDFQDNNQYNHLSYFLDFITRKYGVINVISSGNTGEEVNNPYYINKYKLSQNSIVVGSTNIDGLKRSSFSEWKSINDNILTKPLVAAPGEQYWYYNSGDSQAVLDYNNGSGTSYAAPLVSGLITTLLRNNYHLVKKPASIMAILASSSSKIDGYEKNQSNGLNNEVGAGLINYKRMQIAANNHFDLNLDKSDNQIIEISSPLISKQEISISLSWLFNPEKKLSTLIKLTFPIYPTKSTEKFVLKQKYDRLAKNDKNGYWIDRYDSGWYEPPFGYWGQGYYKEYEYNKNMQDKAEQKYIRIHEDEFYRKRDLEHYKKLDKWEIEFKQYEENLAAYNLKYNKLKEGDFHGEWKSISELKSKNQSNWYTPIDLDLSLQIYDEKSQDWKNVQSSVSSASNVEVIKIKLMKVENIELKFINMV